MKSFPAHPRSSSTWLQGQSSRSDGRVPAQELTQCEGTVLGDDLVTGVAADRFIEAVAGGDDAGLGGAEPVGVVVVVGVPGTPTQ